jgi:hypothetical protein
MSKPVIVSDGSSWPRPALESDDEYGIGHLLRYGTPTRSDLLVAASVIDAYGYLIMESTREKRDLVCREMRTAAKEELVE